MDVKDSFDGFREERPCRRDNALRLPPAVPHAPLVVEIADVAHAMVEAAVVWVRNLGERRGVQTVVIRGRDPWPFDGDLADLAMRHSQIVDPLVNWLVGNPHDLQ